MQFNQVSVRRNGAIILPHSTVVKLCITILKCTVWQHSVHWHYMVVQKRVLVPGYATF